ncbi:apoptosis regulatory protein Siva [Brachionichthys hirsutus]|uniref:apoptosis regulatory protein Siva n=1 Tax=Brachionichthys hirsutus TaxID=412623 RepID=UPI0036044F61
MPKRACPFSETFSSQYKIRIRPQELIRSSVFGDKYRQDMYERTKNLLFNGAMAMGKLWTGEGGRADPSPFGQTPTRSPALLRGQTLIGCDGRLKKANSLQGVMGAPSGCCRCQKNHGPRAPCSQCDRLVCSSCTQQCSRCSSLCCSVCSVTDYSGRYEEVLCCSCAT